MIIKNFELNKLDFNIYNIYLLYGKNDGFQNEIIKKYFTKDFKGEIINYDESEILNNGEKILGEILNKSLFSENKILIISRSSDKSSKFVREMQENKLSNIKIIYKSGVLEKKSKLRNLFEKDKNLIIIPFYEDDQKSLLPILNNFIIKNEIKISRETINLIIERASGSRVSLNNELEKIYNYSLSNKNLEFEVVKKLTNLGENIDLNELVDQYLIKNTKHVSKILNENNYSNEDCMLIIRTILIKSKRLLGIIERKNEERNIESIILSTRPPIFWKEKENVKKQVKVWDFRELKNKIYQISEIETLIKNNTKNSLNILSDFIMNY